VNLLGVKGDSAQACPLHRADLHRQGWSQQGQHPLDRRSLTPRHLPDRVLEVTRYDRELFLRKFPPELRSTAQELPFAALKPPFESALTSPVGEVWLEKSRAPADSSRRYHLVDRRGRLAGEVRIRGQGRIMALGEDAALVAEPTPNGIRLIQVKLPSQPSIH